MLGFFNGYGNVNLSGKRVLTTVQSGADCIVKEA